jgi:hypothetical protein
MREKEIEILFFRISYFSQRNPPDFTRLPTASGRTPKVTSARVCEDESHGRSFFEAKERTKESLRNRNAAMLPPHLPQKTARACLEPCLPFSKRTHRPFHTPPPIPRAIAQYQGTLQSKIQEYFFGAALGG